MKFLREGSISGVDPFILDEIKSNKASGRSGSTYWGIQLEGVETSNTDNGTLYGIWRHIEGEYSKGVTSENDVSLKTYDNRIITFSWKLVTLKRSWLVNELNKTLGGDVVPLISDTVETFVDAYDPSTLLTKWGRTDEEIINKLADEFRESFRMLSPDDEDEYKYALDAYEDDELFYKYDGRTYSVYESMWDDEYDAYVFMVDA